MTTDRFPEGKTYTKNMEVIAYHELGERPAFKMGMLKNAEGWYLYLSHLWHSGHTILEVTDPANPKLIRFIPARPHTITANIQVADGKMITSMGTRPPMFGGEPGKTGERGVLIWDLQDPTDPKRIGKFYIEGFIGHRHYYDGGRYVHLSCGLPGYIGNFYLAIDIDDPSYPQEVSRWWIHGQWAAGGETPPASPHVFLHGGAYVEGNRAYLPYSCAGLVILDLTEIREPKLVSRLPFSPPFNPWIGVHTAMPLSSRKLVLVNSEAVEENCKEPANYVGIVDISDETAPRLISLFPVPEKPPEAPYKNFCEKGGRFGPHNQHQPQHQPCLMQRDDRVYITYFNAGLRIFDISDHLFPKEIGYFIPPDPQKRIGPLPKTLVAQSEDVLVDARGYIYVTDKNLGLYVLRYTE